MGYTAYYLGHGITFSLRDSYEPYYHKTIHTAGHDIYPQEFSSFVWYNRNYGVYVEVVPTPPNGLTVLTEEQYGTFNIVDDQKHNLMRYAIVLHNGVTLLIDFSPASMKDLAPDAAERFAASAKRAFRLSVGDVLKRSDFPYAHARTKVFSVDAYVDTDVWKEVEVLERQDGLEGQYVQMHSKVALLETYFANKEEPYTPNGEAYGMSLYTTAFETPLISRRFIQNNSDFGIDIGLDGIFDEWRPNSRTGVYVFSISGSLKFSPDTPYHRLVRLTPLVGMTIDEAADIVQSMVYYTTPKQRLMPTLSNRSDWKETSFKPGITVTKGLSLIPAEGYTADHATSIEEQGLGFTVWHAWKNDQDKTVILQHQSKFKISDEHILLIETDDYTIYGTKSAESGFLKYAVAIHGHGLDLMVIISLPYRVVVDECTLREGLKRFTIEPSSDEFTVRSLFYTTSELACMVLEHAARHAAPFTGSGYDLHPHSETDVSTYGQDCVFGIRVINHNDPDDENLLREYTTTTLEDRERSKQEYIDRKNCCHAVEV